jgi:hypothetical protein
MSNELKEAIKMVEEQGKDEFNAPEKAVHFFDIWDLASKKYDEETFDHLINEGYRFVDPDGGAYTKDQMIGSVMGGRPDFDYYNQSEFEVIPYGENAALKRSVLTTKGKFHGQEITGRYRQANLFIRDEKGWRISYCQLTRIEEDEPL